MGGMNMNMNSMNNMMGMNMNNMNNMNNTNPMGNMNMGFNGNNFQNNQSNGNFGNFGQNNFNQQNDQSGSGFGNGWGNNNQGQNNQSSGFESKQNSNGFGSFNKITNDKGYQAPPSQINSWSGGGTGAGGGWSGNNPLPQQVNPNEVEVHPRVILNLVLNKSYHPVSEFQTWETDPSLGPGVCSGSVAGAGKIVQIENCQISSKIFPKILSSILLNHLYPEVYELPRECGRFMPTVMIGDDPNWEDKKKDYLESVQGREEELRVWG